MPWEFREDAPIYTQLIAQIQQRIVGGLLGPGARLPSVRDLAAEAGVNPNTMQRALTELEREGIVHSQRTARGHAGRLGGVQELTAHPVHLLFQQAGGGGQTLGFQAVGADELREALALVGRGEVSGLLLIELHLHAFSRQPEGGLAARQTGA